jgi:hypothetical protein
MRGVHFVGSFPAPDAESAMRAMIEGTTAGIQLVPDGETGQRCCWIHDELTALRAHDAVVEHDEEEPEDGRGTPRFSLRPGREAEFTAASLASLPAFDYLRRARLARSVLDGLELEYGRQFTLQQGLPHSLDIAMLAFAHGDDVGDARVAADVFAEHLQRQLHAIIAAAGADTVLFQIESPHALWSLLQRPIGADPDLAVEVAGEGMAKVINRATPQARFGIHLCLREMFSGDPGRRLVTMVPVVAVLEAITDALERPEALEYVHFPFAARGSLPSLDRDVYRPLTGLRERLPDETRIVAGLADERQSLGDQQLVRDIAEDMIGEPVDIAAGCGLGCRTPDAAAKVVARMMELATA